MSTIWERFEIDSVNYLKQNFGHFADFKRQGGVDSTVPDIKVTTKDGNTLYIEAKHSPAQCGQFVLLPDINSRTFIYSNQNINPINQFAEKIIQHMNVQFDEFREAGTAGKDIIMKNDSEIFSSWIIETYKSKGVKYFITNDFIILPINEFNRFFNVTSKYRIKRSGSSNTGKNNIPNVLRYIKSNNYIILAIREEGSKLFIESDDSLHNQRFLLNGYEYMFSERGSEYEIRKLSNTFNANVIFSIELRASLNGLTADEFIYALK